MCTCLIGVHQHPILQPLKYLLHRQTSCKSIICWVGHLLGLTVMLKNKFYVHLQLSDKLLLLRPVYNFHALDLNFTFIWEQIIPDHDSGTTMFLSGVIFVMHGVVWNCGPEVKASLTSFNLPGQFYIIFLSVLDRLVCSFDSYLPLCKLQH